MNRYVLALLVLLYATPAFATFPSMVGSATTDTDTVSGTSHTFDLKPSMTVGNLAFIFWFGGASDGSPNTACTGWTVIEDQAGNFGVSHVAALYRVVDGSEGSTVTCTTDLAEVGSSISIEITGQHATTPPEDGNGTFGTSTAPDPESLNPAAWDVEDTLWIAAAGGAGAGPDFTAFPSGFTTNQVDATRTTAGDLAIATKAERIASQDPGAFTLDSSGHWAAMTIAIRPAVAGSSGGVKTFQLLGVQ